MYGNELNSITAHARKLATYFIFHKLWPLREPEGQSTFLWVPFLLSLEAGHLVLVQVPPKSNYKVYFLYYWHWRLNNNTCYELWEFAFEFTHFYFVPFVPRLHCYFSSNFFFFPVGGANHSSLLLQRHSEGPQRARGSADKALRLGPQEVCGHETRPVCESTQPIQRSVRLPAEAGYADRFSPKTTVAIEKFLILRVIDIFYSLRDKRC